MTTCFQVKISFFQKQCVGVVSVLCLEHYSFPPSTQHTESYVHFQWLVFSEQMTGDATNG